MAEITARIITDTALPDLSSRNFLQLESATSLEATFYDSAKGPIAQHDNDHADFRCIAIFPTADEILAVRKMVYMPKKNVDTPNPYPPGVQRHLDLMFRQLRHESVSQIKEICYSAAQITFLSSANHTHKDEVARESKIAITTPSTFEPRETPFGHRFFLYQGVRVEEFIPNEQHTIHVRLSFDCPESLKNKPISKSGHFEEGMMIALLCHNQLTQDFFVHYFSIHLAQGTRSMERRWGKGCKAAVMAILMPSVTDADVRELAGYAQGVDSDMEFCLVEFPKLMHHGFYHCLEKLQNLTDIAFQNYISPRATTTQPLAASRHADSRSSRYVDAPAYARQPWFAYDLSTVLGSGQHHKRTFTLEELSEQSTLHALRAASILDHGQATALRHCLLNEFAFVQGPPGTGKTYLGIQLTKVLLASRPSNKPILVVCLTNHALDSFLAGLQKAGVTDMIRIGSGSKEEWTEPLNLRNKSKRATLSPNEKHRKKRAKEAQKAAFDQVRSWCQGAAMHNLPNKLSWVAIEKYLSEEDTQIHRQLKISEHGALQQQLFEHWLEGGDIRELRNLRDRLLADLVTEPATQNLLAPQSDTSFDAIFKPGSESVWRMPLRERKLLSSKWRNAVDLETFTDDFLECYSEHSKAKIPTKEINERVDVRILGNANVIGMTTTACARRWNTLQAVGVEIVLFEEAGEVMEPHALCALPPSIKHSISIGDPQQLRPEISDQKLTIVRSPAYRLDESLFERMIYPQDHAGWPLHYEQLTMQRRMHPEIADITRLVYPRLLDHECTLTHKRPMGLDQRVFWWDHRVPELAETSTTKSHVNEHEVNMVTGLVSYLVKGNGYAQGDIAVLTPYTGQLAALHKSLSLTCEVWLADADREKLLTEEQLEIDPAKVRTQEQITMSGMLRVTTVDNFQGEEAKIVILSTVRSGGKPGFLAIKNRINVACSRARNGFFIVGNSETLGQVPMWRNIINLLGPRRGFAIEARCDTHRTHSTVVRDPKEFDLIIDCPAFCETVLSCGHLCNRKCHSQTLHERNILPCEEICGKTLPCGHKCGRPCGVECGTCLVNLSETTLECGHSGFVRCSGEISSCSVLTGHIILECGHQVDQICGQEVPGDIGCEQSCEQTLACGHVCSGTCAACGQSDHPSCTQFCGSPLDCGHACLASCGHDEKCPLCKNPVEVICEHATRSKPCHASAALCMLPQSPPCQHQDDLQIPCAFPLPVLPCSDLCTRTLSCGHPCPCLDSEVCLPAEMCIKCRDTDDIQHMMYLNQCRHIVQVYRMDQCNIQGVFEQDSSGRIVGFGTPDISLLEYPKCYICGTRCPGTHRYSLIEKLVDFEKNAHQLYSEIIGSKFWYLSCQLRTTANDLEDGWRKFQHLHSPRPVANGRNTRPMETRLSSLLSLRDEIVNYQGETVTPFETAVHELHKRFPHLAPWILTTKLRFQLLWLRFLGLWATENVRIGEWHVMVADDALQARGRGAVFLQVVSGVLHASMNGPIADMLDSGAVSKSPGLLAEIQLHRAYFWLLVTQSIRTLSIWNIGATATKDPLFQSVSSALSDVQKVIDTAARYPTLCASFKHTASTYQDLLRKIDQGGVVENVNPPDLSSSFGVEKHFRQYCTDDPVFVTCAEGHLFSEAAFGKDGCPDCGTMVKLDNEQFHENGTHLFENNFLAHLRKSTVEKLFEPSTDLEQAPSTGNRLQRTMSGVSDANASISDETDVTAGEDSDSSSEKTGDTGNDVLQPLDVNMVADLGPEGQTSPALSSESFSFVHLQEDAFMRKLSSTRDILASLQTDTDENIAPLVLNQEICSEGAPPASIAEASPNEEQTETPGRVDGETSQDGPVLSSSSFEAKHHQKRSRNKKKEYRARERDEMANDAGKDVDSGEGETNSAAKEGKSFEQKFLEAMASMSRSGT